MKALLEMFKAKTQTITVRYNTRQVVQIRKALSEGFTGSFSNGFYTLTKEV